MSPIDGDSDGQIPTDEIYLELRELEQLRAAAEQYQAENEMSPTVPSDEPSNLKARIARLKAMLSDRGAPVDE